MVINDTDKSKHAFELGDIVRLRNGQAPMRVVETTRYLVKCEYLSSRKQLKPRPFTDFTLYQDTQYNTEKKENIMTTKLYKTISDNRYGEYKANDGDKLLLLMQDSGTYEAFASSDLKRVMAFTYDVMFTGTGKVYSYLGTEGSVEVGDLLVSDGFALAKVVAIGTESDNATKRFNGVKLLVSALN